MANIYVLVLSGPKDHEYKVVTKEVWDWILSGDPGRPEGNTEHTWKDQTVSPTLLKQIRKYMGISQADIDSGDEEDGVCLSSGSWENDRALQAPCTMFDSLRELVQWTKKHRHKIIDTYEGCIY